ncbi:MAG: hypothetical protein JNM77_08985 [Pseudonocardia sp.]|nr:hypothetical protein [Pseudonocardia sp.]
MTSAAAIPAPTTAPTTDSPSTGPSAPDPAVLDPERARRRPRLRLLRYEPAAEEPTGPPAPPVRTQPTAVHTAVPDSTDNAALRRRAEQVLRLTLEVLDGRRPVAQLAGHMEPRALRYVRAAVARRPAERQPSRMTSLHIDRPCTGAVEVAAVYRRGPRARALAARFERPASPGTAAAREPRTVPGRPAVRSGDPREWRCVTLRLL